MVCRCKEENYDKFLAGMLGECADNADKKVSVFFGYWSIASWIVCYYPQVRMNFIMKSAQAVSLGFAISWLIADIMNVIGGFLLNAILTQQIMFFYWTFMDILLLLEFYIYRKNTSPKFLRDTSYSKFELTIYAFMFIYVITNLIWAGFYNEELLTVNPENYGYCETGDTVDYHSASYIVGTVLAYVTIPIVGLSRVFQIYKNYKRKSVKGLSLALFISSLNAIQHMIFMIKIILFKNYHILLVQLFQFPLISLFQVNIYIIRNTRNKNKSKAQVQINNNQKDYQLAIDFTSLQITQLLGDINDLLQETQVKLSTINNIQQQQCNKNKDQQIKQNQNNQIQIKILNCEKQQYNQQQQTKQSQTIQQQQQEIIQLCSTCQQTEQVIFKNKISQTDIENIELKELQNKLQNQIQDNQFLEQQIKTLSQDLQNQAVLKQQINDQNLKIQIFKHKLSEGKQLNEQILLEIEQNDREIKNLQLMNKNLSNNYQKIINDFKFQQNQINQQNQQLEIQLQQKDIEIQKEKQNNQKISNENQFLKQKIDIINQQKPQLSDIQTQTFSPIFKLCKTQHQILVNPIKYKDDEIQTDQSEFNMVNECIQTLEKDYFNKQIQTDQIIYFEKQIQTDEEISYEPLFYELKEQFQHLLSKHKELQNQNLQLKQTITNQDKVIQQSQDQIDSLQLTNIQYEERINKLSDITQQFQLAIEKLQTENKQLKNDKSILEEKITKMKTVFQEQNE